MPNPISKVAKYGLIYFGNIGLNPFEHNPKLTILAMRCIATWSDVEQFMLSVYVTLAGGAKSDAAAVFLALESDGAKNNAISILAERKLDKTELAILRAIQKLAGAQYKRRNVLAHQTWGYSTDLPDALLLVDPRVTVVWDAPSDDQNIRDHIMVYKDADFISIINENERVAHMGMMFRQLIDPNVSLFVKEAIPSRLFQEPEIAETLRRLDEQSQTKAAK